MAAAQARPEPQHPQQPGNAVARTEEQQPRNALRKLDQDAARALIEPLLDAGRTYEAVVSEVRLAAAKNPEIMECTPDSVVTAVARAVNTGGTIGKDVHLVPLNVKVSKRGQPDRWEKRLDCWEDYKFLREMILRTGGARRIVVKPLYANEAFQYQEGVELILRHTPEFDPEKRGPLVGAYAYAQVGPRPTDLVVEVMHRDEIQQILSKSKSWKDYKLDSIIWYAMKTVLRRLAKALPKNPRLAAVLRKLGIGERDEEEFEPGPALPEGSCHGHAKDLQPLAENWSRSRPLANQADGFGYGDGDETAIPPEQLRSMANAPDPFTDEPPEEPYVFDDHPEPAQRRHVDRGGR